MILKILGYAGVAVVSLLLAQTMITSYYLGKINGGLQTSLDATASLIQIQHTIIQKNTALQDVIATTKAMDAQLNNTLKTTQSIHAHIDSINELNSATLELNVQMNDSANQSGQTLKDVSSGLNELSSASKSMAESLAKLKMWVQQDSRNLERMRAYTDDMNDKLPGVLK